MYTTRENKRIALAGVTALATALTACNSSNNGNSGTKRGVATMINRHYASPARRSWRPVALLLALLALGALAAGCSSAAGSRAAAGNGKKYSLIMVGHGPETDPSAVLIIRGMKDFCATNGLSCKYRGPQKESLSAADQAKVIDAALAEHPDAMLITDPAPDGLNTSIKSVVDAGIPVALVNQATTADVEATGALQAVAADPFTTGNLSAKAMMAAGVKHPLVLSVTPGIPFVDQRVAGFLAAYPKGAVNVLQLPIDNINNPTAVVKASKAALVKDHEADGVLSVGVLFNAPMLSVREQLGPRGNNLKWASIDVGDAAISALQSGDMLFAADEQPYLQGYLSAQTVYLKLKGLEPGQPFIKSGPAMVTPDNVKQYKKAVEAGVRG